ncbi:DUF948 domain-containing protein [Trichlorobacter ammonificans]|uniref:DUF948 domain-containing protein n=1 Tax=Trichlorobacter ammonificans TaxID=2916410 RepID=A0ABM9D6I3_9BACT|nr:DUF948 domain-containing protein [Trichlorobacter ammonificans]CAH2030332.1 conserved protein of unknown function [Trichlorobacter ammonificans]
MSLGALAALIAALALVVLVIALIPAIAAVKRTATSVSVLADLLTNELKPTIRELNDVLAELKTVGGGVAQHTDDVKKFMSALGDTGDQLTLINRSVGAVTGIVNQAGVLVTGAKVAGSYLLEHYLKRKMKGV